MSESIRDSSSAKSAERRSPIDLEALCLRWEDWDFAQRLLRRFRERAPGDLRLIESHAATGDLDQVTRLAHGLRGAAAYVAADAVRWASEQLEAASRERNIAKIEDALSVLKSELARISAMESNESGYYKCRGLGGEPCES